MLIIFLTEGAEGTDLSGGGGGDGGVGGVGGVESLGGGDAELLVEGHLVPRRRPGPAALEGGVVDVEPGEERADDLVAGAVLPRRACSPPHHPPSLAPLHVDGTRDSGGRKIPYELRILQEKKKKKRGKGRALRAQSDLQDRASLRRSGSGGRGPWRVEFGSKYLRLAVVWCGSGTEERRGKRARKGRGGGEDPHPFHNTHTHTCQMEKQTTMAQST